MEEQSVHSSISDINSEEAVRSERKFANFIISSIVIWELVCVNKWYAYTVGTCNCGLTLPHNLSKLTRPNALVFFHICHLFRSADKGGYLCRLVSRHVGLLFSCFQFHAGEMSTVFRKFGLDLFSKITSEMNNLSVRNAFAQVFLVVRYTLVLNFQWKTYLSRCHFKVNYVRE